jgi:hypothetical protein
MSAIAINITGAGPAVATGIGGEIVSLVSPKAFAPGQPLTFTLAAELAGVEFQAKSLGSKRRADGQFDLRVRLVNLSRSSRERLTAILSDTPPERA